MMLPPSADVRIFAAMKGRATMPTIDDAAASDPHPYDTLDRYNNFCALNLLQLYAPRAAVNYFILLRAGGAPIPTFEVVASRYAPRTVRN